MKNTIKTLKNFAMLSGLMTLSASTAIASVGTEGAAFLNIPVGAGPAAMGSAYTALANNAYAPVYNPAGLSSLTGHGVAAQHLSYLESIHYEHVSYVLPFKGKDGISTRGLGFSVQYLGTGDMEGMSDTGTPIGSFDSHYASYNIAYGQRVSQRLSLGVTGKMIHAQIDDVSANAYAMDLGSSFQLNEKLTLAGTLTNLGNKLKFINEGDSLPMAAKFGAAFKPSRRWLLSGEGVYRKNGLASAHAGGQWRPIEMISLRVGYKTDTLEGLNAMAGLTAGVGLHLWNQELAYAWSPYGDLGDAQYLSLLMRFGVDKEAQRNLIQYKNIRKHQTVQKQNKSDDDMEPEYQQLMQLLSADDVNVAKKK